MNEAPRLLVVDDEVSIVAMLARYFGALGFRVTSTGELEEAEALLLNGEFTAVIADLRLTSVHGAEGLELITFVRKHSPATRMILLTACDSEDVHREALRRGADLVLEKPQGLPELARALETLLVEPES